MVPKDPVYAIESCAGEEVKIQELYTSKTGLGEYLLGDGTHIMKIWLSFKGEDVKISLENVEGKPVDPSKLTKENISGNTGLAEIARLQEKTRVRIEREREQAYANSIPSDMIYDANGKPMWDRYKQEQRAHKQALQNQNTRHMKSFQNFGKNIKSSPNYMNQVKPKEKTNNHDQEYSKPLSQTEIARAQCKNDPKGNWINGRCIYFTGKTKFTNKSAQKRKAIKKYHSKNANVPNPKTPEKSKKKRGFTPTGNITHLTAMNDTFLGKSTSVDLAKTNIGTQAGKYCGSQEKVKIYWLNETCKPSKDGKLFKCTVNAKAECSSTNCKKLLCGTRH
jgi:hypothetical protein